MEVGGTVPIVLLLSGGVVLLVHGWLFNLTSLSGVRHIQRYYYTLILSFCASVSAFLIPADQILYCVLIAIPVGGLRVWASIKDMNCWYYNRFDGDVLWNDPLDTKGNSIYIVGTPALVCVSSFFWELSQPYIFILDVIVLSVGVVLFFSSVFGIGYISRMESIAGHPIIEQERDNTLC